MIALSEFKHFHEVQNAAAVYQRLAGKINELKGRLQTRFETHLPGHQSLIKTSIEEAEVIAWRTPFPHLFLPDLVEERITRFASDLTNRRTVRERAS
jgi:hypothetical protein